MKKEGEGSGEFSPPQALQWLADNGSAYTAGEAIDSATTLNLVACFTPVRSPESNGVCEAFGNTFKRNYARANPRPDAISVLQRLAEWFEDYNTVHPHARRRPSSYPSRRCVQERGEDRLAA